MNQVHPTRRLVVLDVDSTLIEQEVVEILAKYAGRELEVAEVTERAMKGELDFAGSLRARVIQLAGLPSSVFERALAEIRITKGAEQLIQSVHAAGGFVGAVSGGFSQILEPLAKKLNLDFALANKLEVLENQLTGLVLDPIIDKPAKATALRNWAADTGIALNQTIAIGDGANDLDMMAAAGLSIGFNAKPRVRVAADLLIDSGDLSDAIKLLGL